MGFSCGVNRFRSVQILVKNDVCGVMVGVTVIINHENPNVTITNQPLIVCGEMIAIQHNPVGPDPCCCLAGQIKIGKATGFGL